MPEFPEPIPDGGDWKVYRSALTRLAANQRTKDSLERLHPEWKGGADEPTPPVPEAFVPSVLELRWGGGHAAEQRRFFGQSNMCDAVVRLSERVLELDRDPAISAAFASLRRVRADGSDGLYGGDGLVNWTKCSDERPTSEGAETPEGAGV